MKVTLITVVLMVSIASATGMASGTVADEQAIMVGTVSVHKPLVNVQASRAGKALSLACFLTDSSCTIPKSGRYWMVHSSGPYTDCPNVRLYRKQARTALRQEIGVYCLEDTESCSMAECRKMNVPLVRSELPDFIPENPKH